MTDIKSGNLDQAIEDGGSAIVRRGLEPGDAVVVTGAARGFGRAIARRLASGGARLALWDFLDDPRFLTALYDFVPGKGTTLNLAAPCPTGKSSRCVVLKPRLETSSVEFAHYVIAHEFAHAYLRNGGWGAINDHEEAADALAASWGFSRPPRSLWPFSKWPSQKS